MDVQSQASSKYSDLLSRIHSYNQTFKKQTKDRHFAIELEKDQVSDHMSKKCICNICICNQCKCKFVAKNAIYKQQIKNPFSIHKSSEYTKEYIKKQKEQENKVLKQNKDFGQDPFKTQIHLDTTSKIEFCPKA